MRDLEQHAVRIAMNNSCYGTPRIVADRICVFAHFVFELRDVRNVLPGNRIVGITRIDQSSQRLRQRNGIASLNGIQSRLLFRGHQTTLAKLPDRTKRFHDLLLHTTYGSTTGVHITWSIRCAPVASITSRSSPSAIPLACGICPSAARKSSSTG